MHRPQMSEEATSFRYTGGANTAGRLVGGKSRGHNTGRVIKIRGPGELAGAWSAQPVPASRRPPRAAAAALGPEKGEDFYYGTGESRKGHGRPLRRRVGLRDAVEALVEGRFQRTHLRSPRPVAQLLLLPPLPRLSQRGAGGLVLPLRKGRVARWGACCWTAAGSSRIAAFQGDKAVQELVVEDELLASLAPVVVVEAARRAILLGPTAGLVRALLWPRGGRRRVCALLWPRHGCWWLSGDDGRQTRRRRWCAPLRLPREGVEHFRGLASRAPVREGKNNSEGV